MCSGFLRAAGLLVCLAAGAAEARTLRVCADPNNMPFSNAAGQGFENRIVALVAAEIGAEVAYTWRAQRRGFLRETLRAEVCDLVPGLPTRLEGVATTRPYYASAYVFVARADGPHAASFDDEALRRARLGVQLVGDDGWNTPPAHALSRRGIVGNVRGFMIYGDYRDADPGAPIVDAVGRGDIDIALVWGPVAGYYAARREPRLDVTPVSPLRDTTEGEPPLPMAWDIAMGVRRGDEALRREIDEALARLAPKIDAVLAEYHVPRIVTPAPRQGGTP